jgi:hypothetical protein
MLLRTSDTFLAYVSVPEGSSWQDKEDALPDFYYRDGTQNWVPVPGCQSSFSCDVSVLPASGALSVKAVFSEAGYRTSSATYSQ